MAEKYFWFSSTAEQSSNQVRSNQGIKTEKGPIGNCFKGKQEVSLKKIIVESYRAVGSLNDSCPS